MIGVYEVLWFFIVPAIIECWVHLLRNWRRLISKPGKVLSSSPRIIFLVATRNCPKLVQESVNSIHYSCHESGFLNYEVKIITDEEGSPIEEADKIVVPRDFVAKSKFKARALHYALHYLPCSKEVWFFHLDEDTKLTPQCVQSILRYIKEVGKPIANGPTVFPLQKSLIAFFAEAHRHWTFYWLMDQMRSSRPHWMNGSNMLVRSDVEHEVGWDHGDYLSEDARFAYEAKKKLGKVFGWHGGLTIEQPPRHIGAVLKQRRRWFYGGILNLKHVPKTQLPRRIYSMLAWLDGFFLAVFLFLTLTGVYPVASWVLSILIFTGFIWLARYQLGLFRNLQYSEVGTIKKIGIHVCLLIFTPFLDLICNFPTVWSLVNPPRVFEMTEKISK